MQHFCFPWFIGSDVAVRCAREAGYEVLYWGILADTRTNRPGNDPLKIMRLEDQYIYRLPGKGRMPLRALLGEKVKANLPGLASRLGQ